MVKSSVNYSHRLGEPLPQRIVIVRALQLGDLCAVPVFRALRIALPTPRLPWLDFRGQKLLLNVLIAISIVFWNFQATQDYQSGRYTFNKFPAS